MSLDFSDIDTWLDALAAVEGIAWAGTDPAEIQTPGVWCRITAFGPDVAAADHYRVDLELYLAVSEADWRRARDRIAVLFSLVHDYLGNPPARSLRFVRLQLPTGGEVPALLVPHTLRIVPDPPA